MYPVFPWSGDVNTCDAALTGASRYWMCQPLQHDVARSLFQCVSFIRSCFSDEVRCLSTVDGTRFLYWLPSPSEPSKSKHSVQRVHMPVDCSIIILSIFGRSPPDVAAARLPVLEWFGAATTIADENGGRRNTTHIQRFSGKRSS